MNTEPTVGAERNADHKCNTSVCRYIFYTNITVKELELMLSNQAI